MTDPIGELRAALLDANTEIERLREQLRKASHHVYRQQKHGKHEQDRADAVEWMNRWEQR